MKERAVLAAFFVLIGSGGIAEAFAPVIGGGPPIPWLLWLVIAHGFALLFVLALIRLRRLQDGADGDLGHVGKRLLGTALRMYALLFVLTAVGTAAYGPGSTDVDRIPDLGLITVTVVLTLEVLAGLFALAGVVVLTIATAAAKLPPARGLCIFLAGSALEVLLLLPVLGGGEGAPVGIVVSGVGLVILGITVWRREPRSDGVITGYPPPALAVSPVDPPP